MCKLDGGVRRHDCVNCTHLPDICRVLSVLQVQILDPYFTSDPGDSPGQVLLQCPDGVRIDAVRQSGQGVQRSTFQVPEEAREAAEVIKRTANQRYKFKLTVKSSLDQIAFL